MKTAAKHVVLGLICCLLRAQPCLCQTACVDEDGFIVVNATPAWSTSGLDFSSAGGHLIPDPDPAPFLFFLSNRPNLIVIAIVPGTVTIDGDLVTSVGWDGQGNPASDLLILYCCPTVPDPIPVTGYCVGKADFNLDSVVDLLDIDLLGLQISERTNDASFDLSSDQLVNQDDLNLFLSGNIITDGNKLNGDADFDGTVAFADFLTLSSNFGQDGKKWSEGDFIANGRVEFADFLVLSANFGQTADSVTQVPEPHTGVMLLVGLALLVPIPSPRARCAPH